MWLILVVQFTVDARRSDSKPDQGAAAFFISLWPGRRG
jgi:hypothetical protein